MSHTDPWPSSLHECGIIAAYSKVWSAPRSSACSWFFVFLWSFLFLVGCWFVYTNVKPCRPLRGLPPSTVYTVGTIYAVLGVFSPRLHYGNRPSGSAGKTWQVPKTSLYASFPRRSRPVARTVRGLKSEWGCGWRFEKVNYTSYKPRTTQTADHELSMKRFRVTALLYSRASTRLFYWEC